MGNSNVMFSELYSFDLYNHLLTAVKQKSPGVTIIRYHGYLLECKVSKIELMEIMPLCSLTEASMDCTVLLSRELPCHQFSV